MIGPRFGICLAQVVQHQAEALQFFVGVHRVMYDRRNSTTPNGSDSGEHTGERCEQFLVHLSIVMQHTRLCDSGHFCKAHLPAPDTMSCQHFIMP